MGVGNEKISWPLGKPFHHTGER